jgi:hypothetical protein
MESDGRTEGDFHHLRPALGVKSPSGNYSLWERPPPLCHPERSRGICSSTDHSWKCFSSVRHPVEVDPQKISLRAT